MWKYRATGWEAIWFLLLVWRWLPPKKAEQAYLALVRSVS